MAYKDFDGLDGFTAPSQTHHTMSVDGPVVELPDASYVKDAALQRDGMDLILEGPHGTIVIDNYYAAAEAPDLVAPTGETLTPELVHSFAQSPALFAQANTMTDASPVGVVDEISGSASVTRIDGSTETITMGTPIYQGDVIETQADGAVNISFIDETSFAVSEDARLAIDEYVYDPSTEAGTQNFSVLKGVFVFTSGLIGRDDPDDVNISTPTGSIGIRGTIIAGNVDSGEITVVEGAIVVRDLGGNEMTLATQFETAKILAAGGVENLGRLAANDVSERFVNISNVSPKLFSSINDAAAEQSAPDAQATDKPVDAPQDNPGENFDANGTVDKNGDSGVDGTVEGGDNAGSTEGSAQPAPTQEPVAKVAMVTKTGVLGTETLGTNTSGIAPTTTTSTTTQALVADGAQTLTKLATFDSSKTLAVVKAPPPPSTQTTTTQDLTDPNAINAPPPTTTTTNARPFNVSDNPQFSTAPDAFFKLTSGQGFGYHFDLEFRDPNPGDVLTYNLTQSTRAALTTLFGAQGTGWNFDHSNGFLNIQPPGTIAADTSFNIEIVARDQAGNISTPEIYTMHLLNADTVGTLPTMIDNVNNSVFSSTGNTADTTLIGSAGVVTGNAIFSGAGNDTVTLAQGNNNYINLGNGVNTAIIDGAASNTNNTIVGSFDRDTITVRNLYNKVFGMDGDDVIRMDVNAATLNQLQSTSPAGPVLIDGGHDNYVPGNLASNGMGDTLFLQGTGAQTLNFANINNAYFRGIERIDSSATLNVTVRLNYQDIIDMTDNQNTLILRGDAGDTFQFLGTQFANFTKTAQVLNDNYNGGATSTTFDVYTDGNVTLLVDQAANATGLPA